MDFITSPLAIAEWSAEARSDRFTVGFVPTMGALHEGHLDLVSRALQSCDRVVCSVFVNPLQFNDPEDLARYPRQIEKDRALLAKVGCHALFAPEREALFAGSHTVQYDLDALDAHWEGPSRPGHFQGVVNVVERLFHYVRPDAAFFGEKDRQQLTILTRMARKHRWPERIVGCPTVRAADGLALSSRNARLDPDERALASTLYHALEQAAEVALDGPLAEAHRVAIRILTKKGIGLDYFGFARTDDLRPMTEWGAERSALALLAAHVGPVRLIDNILLVRRTPTEEQISDEATQKEPGIVMRN